MKKHFNLVMLFLSFIFALNFTGCTIFTQPGGHFYSLGGSSHVTYDGRWSTEESISLIPDSGLAIISSRSEVDEVFGESIYNEEQAWTNDIFLKPSKLFALFMHQVAGVMFINY